jgi:hypothetical protein
MAGCSEPNGAEHLGLCVGIRAFRQRGAEHEGELGLGDHHDVPIERHGGAV